MRYVKAGHVRALDRIAMESLGVSGITLMERAGAGVARAAQALAAGLPPMAVFTVLAGGGNNGGDGLVAARLLHQAGHNVEVLLTRPPAWLQGDARTAYTRLSQAGVPCRVLSRPADWQGPASPFAAFGVCVDALLGTGATGVPRGAAAAAIGWLRRAAGRSRILAVDLPSGLDADSGNPHDTTVHADLTVTFGHPKPAMRRAELLAVFGRIEVLDIGLPPLPADWADGEDALIAAMDWVDQPIRRPFDAHKGTAGHVLVAGGSPGFYGAPLLCALAALRTGAGRVSLATPGGASVMAAAALAPELMVHALPEKTPGTAWSDEAWEGWAEAGRTGDVVVAGPGMGVSACVRRRVRKLAADQHPLVLDADALNVWERDAQALRPFGDRLVLTPHPAEAARLLGCDVATVQRNRPAALQRLVEATGAVVVLKGAGTLVQAPGKALHLNPTGNPGMATAGAGDVLAGMIGALIGQGLNGFDAARLGVYLHGSAGDLAARVQSQAGLTARDLIDRLGEARLQLQPR